MSSTRARPSGIAGAILDKQANKFNDEEASLILQWISGFSISCNQLLLEVFLGLIKEELPENVDRLGFQEVMKDGSVLCK